jgi:peroxiredoxin
MKKIIILIIIIISVVLIIGCKTEINQDLQQENQNEEIKQNDDVLQKNNPPVNNWLDIELYDITSESNFKISDFAGKKVFIESFAVWCPTCTKQQKEIKKFHEEFGDVVISISLDTDPNEDVNKVKEHITENNFDWHYAVSPKKLTESLIDIFGIGVVNAPQVPIILICEDQSVRMLKKGIKKSDALKEELEAGC